ncbi:MAG: CsgG/HfaB family protein [Spirochaetota bacterium]|nr:CsgG/HfaB family protein [Spirochaetota bacterium]
MYKQLIPIIIVLAVLFGCQTTTDVEKKTSGDAEKTSEEVVKFTGEPAYVAISDFSILASDDALAFLATEIPNDLAGGFAKGGLVKPVERQELEKVMEELKLSMSGLTDEDYALQAGKLLGAKYLLFGSLSKIGEQVKINCRLIETETSQIVYTESSRGMYSTLFDVEDELREKIELYFHN